MTNVQSVLEQENVKETVKRLSKLIDLMAFEELGIEFDLTPSYASCPIKLYTRKCQNGAESLLKEVIVGESYIAQIESQRVLDPDAGVELVARSNDFAQVRLINHSKFVFYLNAKNTASGELWHAKDFPFSPNYPYHIGIPPGPEWECYGYFYTL